MDTRLILGNYLVTDPATSTIVPISLSSTETITDFASVDEGGAAGLKFTADGFAYDRRRFRLRGGAGAGELWLAAGFGDAGRGGLPPPSGLEGVGIVGEREVVGVDLAKAIESECRLGGLPVRRCHGFGFPVRPFVQCRDRGQDALDTFEYGLGLCTWEEFSIFV
jgi:hypothetical protein